VEAILNVQGITKMYRNGRGIRDVSFAVHRGDVFGLFGPNGAGKTTLLKIIAGLVAAERGDVQLFGHGITTHFEKAMKRVSCLIETADAYAYMSAYNNLKLVARFYPDLPRTRISETLEWVGLGPYSHEKVSEFSIGMKQRLGLAAAFLPDPDLVILDEPTNGLDIEGMVEIRKLILKLASERGTTFLISSHMIDEMERICNRIGILKDGSMICQGKVHELLNGQMTLEQLYMSAINSTKGAEGYATFVGKRAE